MSIKQKPEITLQTLMYSIEQLREALIFAADEKYAEHGGIWNLAIYRRFSCSYFSFITYLVTRLNLDDKPVQDIDLDLICARACEEGLLFNAEKEVVLDFSIMYTALTYYDEEYDVDGMQMLKDIPEKYEFLESFIARQASFEKRNPLLELSL